MNEQQAAAELRILVLEDALHNVMNTVEFLHGCLTDERFEYAHPELTEVALRLWKQLVSPRLVCVHSKINLNCPACQSRMLRQKRKAELETLASQT